MSVSEAAREALANEEDFAASWRTEALDFLLFLFFDQAKKRRKELSVQDLRYAKSASLFSHVANY
ncbi:MAG: hypothetical protein U5N56_11590 [Candidatus Marinimicrobia bacterium]|nr:hypothetical protein [Candidatus Neomarinimicrobiota bacterium]